MRTASLGLILLLTLPVLLYSQTASFSDVSSLAGINNKGKNYGVAFGDFNLDGHDDIYISRGNAANILYQNNGDGSYTDVAQNAGVDYVGYTHMSIWGDVDNDGDLDLFLGNRNEPNILYRNEGNGTFSNISSSAGISTNSLFTRSVMFGDVNNDGYIDLYVANVFDQNVLYKNNGNNTFTNIIGTSGAIDTQNAMGAMFFDYDNDNDLDIYLTHDANQPYILYQNNGSGQFTDVSSIAGVNYAGQGMGTDFGDFNNDGYMDIYITNLYENVLYQNNGDGTFSDISITAGIEDPGMGWGVSWLDYNNDGLQDIYISNDTYFTPSVSPNKLYENNGDDTFTEVSIGTPINSPYAGYGTACTDFNMDGRLDLFVANHGATDGNQLFKNEGNTTNNWIKIKTIGTTSNRDGIGARVEVSANGQLYADQVNAGGGFAAQNSMTLHFGVGSSSIIDNITIYWPSGLVETFNNLSPNQLLVITEGQGLSVALEEINLNKIHKIVDFQFQNPSKLKVQFEYLLKRDAKVQLKIYDIYGRSLVTLVDQKQAQGDYTLDWYPTNSTFLSHYFVQISVDHFSDMRQLILLGN